MTTAASESTRELTAFHQAFGAELAALLELVPLQAGMRVLDVACGDGFFVSALERKVGKSGLVFGLDASVDILRRLSQQAGQAFVAARLDEAPLVPERLDAVWCCQSLFSLPEPVQCLARMGRLVRPGGLVVVLENDSLHQLMLPWPPELELAIRTAEYATFGERSPQPQKFYVGRWLPRCFRHAGLEPRGFATKTIDREAPLDPAAEAFLRLHLRQLRNRIRPRLDARSRRALDDLLRDDEGESWFRDPSFTLTWMNVLAWACRPEQLAVGGA